MDNGEHNESSLTAVIIQTDNDVDDDSLEESQLRIVEDDVPVAG